MSDDDALGKCNHVTWLLWSSLIVRLVTVCIIVIQAIRTRGFTWFELTLLAANEVVFGVLWDSMRTHCSLVLNQNAHLALLFVQIGSVLIVALSLWKASPRIIVGSLLLVSVAGLGILQFIVLDTTSDLFESGAGLIYGLTQALILSRIVCVLH